MPAVQAQGNPQPVAVTQAVVPQIAAIVQGNTAVGSAIAALQVIPSQILINPVLGATGAVVIYTPSAATIAALLADMEALQTANQAQLSSTYGITS
jgi:hypothetical protein